MLNYFTLVPICSLMALGFALPSFALPLTSKHMKKNSHKNHSQKHQEERADEPAVCAAPLWFFLGTLANLLRN